jgi:RluA family pseudouridine synthase
MDLNLDDIVLWSDDHILGINKPSGLLSLPDGYDPSQPHLKSVLEPHYGRLWIVHRLDRETSGIILLGRSKAAHRGINTQFQEGKVEKTYHALVVGTPSWDQKRVALSLLPDGDRKHRTIVDHTQGKASLTEFRVLQRLETHSLLEACPKTGRTHQIRAHLRAIEYPIIGDNLYGDVNHPQHNLLPRLGLHAFSLVLSHPISRERLAFQAPYPDDFSEFLSNTVN